MVFVPQIVKDISPDADSAPSNLIDVNGTLFFTVDNDANGVDLWKSNGTNEGTVKVQEISGDSNSSESVLLTVLDGSLYFVAANGTELWTSDGTDVGTTLVSDLSNSGTSITGLTLFDQSLFFTVDDDGSNKVRLWKSDGTTEGTKFIKDISAGGSSSNAPNFTEAAGKLFFTANKKLWSTDGTQASTVKMSNVKPFVDEQSNMVEFDGKLYFVGNNKGKDLWVSDGTETGTQRVKDFTNNKNNVAVRHLTVFNGSLFFTTNADNMGKELWMTDGTEAGTRLFKDIRSGGATSNASPRYLTVFNDKLFFRANDGDGNELWVSDGNPDNPAGTFKLKDINGAQPSDPEDLTVHGGILYFTAIGSEGRELWQTDGTESGTVQVSDINLGRQGSFPDHLTTVGKTLFFSADDGTNGEDLWALEQNCFLPGTQILTDKGDIAIENLQIGDRVKTADGGLQSIKWIGRQTVVPKTVRNPLRSYPIQIKAGALGPSLPKRDLYVSPDHALLFEDLLINAGALVNDVSIVQMNPTQTFTYYHIELDCHALLVVEGTYAESYLPQKEDRNSYDNGAEYDELYPNGSRILLWPLDYPRISSYGTVPRYIRKKLRAIAINLADVA